MEQEKKTKKNTFLRLGALVLFIITSILLVKYTALGAWLSLESMQYMVEQTGFWGILIFIAIFVTSAIMNIPGTAFLLLAIMLFGYWQGAFFAYVGALLGAWATFVLGRTMGGKALTEIKNPTVKKLLAEVEIRPIRTLIVLRILVQFSPFVGYTLALTNINQRQYMIGNIIGILIPTIGLSMGMYFFEDTIRALFG
ncbi:MULTISPECIES: TVP38/TMEM64 family protein [unclassified Aureispira]|uniref:TVP38/TMEM64 family protein n=1 Tax=unclassified Aureispira TaxID=2649989 RepID=UPI000696A8A4|nr:MULTISPECIES: VTT domain-containing protein [unclassified Aureispira]WMX17390.1 VTT domain-containing protein [Aureispira sp. CCB-E]